MTNGQTVLPGASANLAKLSQGTAASVVIPDSGFIDQQLDSVQALPLQPLGDTLDTALVIGRSSENRYRAGMAWAGKRGHNDVKLSLFRQQTLDQGLDGLWLASLRGELTPTALLQDFDLTAELALVAQDGTSQRTARGSGIRLNLARKPVNGFGYGLALSQFSRGFHPYGSVVTAGERRLAAELGYRPWSGAKLTAGADYMLRDRDGDAPCAEYRTDLSFSSRVFAYLKARLETSSQRALDCATHAGDIDNWTLTLSENAWTGWDINLVADVSQQRLPFTRERRTQSHYRVSAEPDLRLGPRWASIRPQVSLRTVTDTRQERRLQTGLVMDIENHMQNITLYLGYESLSGSGAADDNAGKIKLAYRLDFDA
ncbi:hypothetical protein [Marinobacterium rhizophilum]|uniref:Beta-barrel porin 2 n=1 Tax=Marinobacterium rhizophilum TaxID=420402 RepID=A0ABY5HM12_9GAMM|nr:hypothetical protein [Marinobacterium rhizophilum]UTW12633.1 hypothetical protein KDW95_02820 [Marinobacterium rhizophilum]